MPSGEDIVSLARGESIKGVSFRHVRGKSDYAAIADIVNRSWKADLFVGVSTGDDIARDLGAPVGFSVEKDAYVVELHDKPVGFSRILWADRLGEVRSYIHAACLVPEARIRGLRQAMFRIDEARIIAKAAHHKRKCEKYFETEANSKRNDWNSLALRNGYVAYRHVFEMVRPDFNNIPVAKLPESLEVRSVRKTDERTVWRATREAFKDEPNYRAQTWSDSNLKWFSGSRWWTPKIWQIAWDGEEVAGGVMNMIDEEENKTFNRNWGYSFVIFTRKPWRRKGIAAALIARSLRVLEAQGVENAALAVDTENPTGALRLYKKMGYKVHSQYSFYRKPIR